MCGIVGYVGSRSAFPLLKAGLARVEYRGYDSAGVAVLAGTHLSVVRTVGRVEKLDTVGTDELDARIGIAHTRWATHGSPTVTNAPPHVDCEGRLAVVHNGIIENYAELRASLTSCGHRFRSDTDTEVIAHALEELSTGDLEATLQKVMEILRGDYALVVLSEQEPHRLFGARKGHPPLIVGVGDGEAFLASDLLPLVGCAPTAVPVEQGEMVVVTADRVEISRLGEPVRRSPVAIPWTPEEAACDGHADFTHKEIHEQPSAIRRTLAVGLGAGQDGAGRQLSPIAPERWRELGHMTIVACGTSYHAGLVGRYFFESLARIPVSVEVSSEFLFREPLLGPKDLCIFVSQSGETADTLAALDLARAQRATSLAVCNVAGSSLTREVDAVVMTVTGPEIGVASTKAFTAQVVAFLRLAIEAGSARGTVSADQRQRLAWELSRVPCHVEDLLRDEDRVADVAALFRDFRDFFFLGRGVCYPLALEGALKLKEIAYVRAEAFPAGELKHGPLALVDGSTVAVALAPTGRTVSRMAATVQEVKARGGQIIALCSAGDQQIASMVDATLPLPKASDYAMPALIAIPLQLFAYHVARLRGCEVDRPRNLAKSVTVE